MAAKPSPTTAPRPAWIRRALQGAVWVIFAAVVAGGLSLSQPGTSASASSTPSPEVLAAVVAAPDAAPPLDSKGLAGAADYGKGTDSIELLPAWRWRTATGLYANNSVKDRLNAGKSGLEAFASLFFFLGAWIWYLLLSLVRFALTQDMVRAGGDQINNGFAGLYASIKASGVVLVLVLVAALMALKAVMTGRLGRAWSLGLTLLLPLAIMQGLAGAASSGTGAKGVEAKGTPAWLAYQGVQLTDEVGAGLGSGFGVLATDGGVQGAANGPSPSCTAYTKALYRHYESFAEAKGGLGGAQRSVATVSYLWQRGFSTHWANAQFGSNADGARIVCHKFEDSAGVPAGEQFVIATSAGYKGLDGSMGQDLFKQNGGKTHEAQMFAWAACRNSGSAWSVGPAWSAAKLSAGDCAKWWKDGKPGEALKWSTSGSLRSDLDGQAAASATPKERKEVYELVSGYWGHNTGQRVVAGLMALITAIVYLYALGAIALGSIVSQVGLVVMLMLLPATLVALAVPSSRSGANPMGRKMLRLTGGFFAAKLTMTLVMVLLLQVMITFEGILGSDGGGLDGFMSSLIPIAALLLVRKLLSAAGMGDITKVSGAVGLNTATALAASGDKVMRAKGMGAMDKAGGDRSLGAGTARSLGRIGAYGAHKADKRFDLSERLGLDERKTQILGRRDDKGEVVERGLAQQVRWFGNLTAKAQGSRLGQSAIGAAMLNDSVDNKAGDWVKRSRYDGNQRKAVANERQARRQLITATRGKSAEGRETARRAFLDEHRLAQRMLRQSAIDPTQAPPEFLSDTEVREEVLGTARENELLVEQVVGSRLGMGATHVPVVGNSDGTGRTMHAKTKEASMELSRDVTNFIESRYKLRRSGESDESYNYRLNQYRAVLGGIDLETGARIDWAKKNGIDLDTAEGEAEWIKDQAGQLSAFANVTAYIPADLAAAIDREAREIDSLSGRYDSSREGATIQRELAVNQVIEASIRTRTEADLGMGRINFAATDAKRILERRSSVELREVKVLEMSRNVKVQEAQLQELRDAGADADHIKNMTKQLEKDSGMLNREQIQLTVERESLTEHIGLLSELQERIFAEAEESSAEAMKALYEASKLRYFSEMDLIDTGHSTKSRTELLKEIEAFERAHTRDTAAASAAVAQAQGAVMSAATAKESMAAVEGLAQLVKGYVNDANRKGEESARHWGSTAKMVLDAEETRKANQARFGNPTQKKRSSQWAEKVLSFPSK